MKILMRGLIYAVLVGFYLVEAMASVAEDQPQVHMEFSCETNSYAIGEPIWASISVSNNLSEEVKFQFGYHPSMSFSFSADIKDVCSAKEHNLGGYDGFLFEGQVKPGEVYTNQFLLTDYLAFEVAGKYEVHCNINFPVLFKGKPVLVSPNLKDEIWLVKDDALLKKRIAEIAEGLNSQDLNVRFKAVRALASSKHPDSIGHLGLALKDPDQSIISFALMEIGNIGTEEAYYLLLAFAEENKGTVLGDKAEEHLTRKRKFREIRQGSP